MEEVRGLLCDLSSISFDGIRPQHEYKLYETTESKPDLDFSMTRACNIDPSDQEEFSVKAKVDVSLGICN